MAAKVLVHHYTILGHIVPYTRTTYQGKFTDRAQKYYSSQENIRRQFQEQFIANGWQKLPKAPFEVTIRFYMPEGELYRSDLDNKIKAIMDSAQDLRKKIGRQSIVVSPGVISDDRYAVRFDVSKGDGLFEGQQEIAYVLFSEWKG